MSGKHNFEVLENYGSEFSDYSSETEVALKRKAKQKDLELRKTIGSLGVLRGGTGAKIPSKRRACDVLDEEGSKIGYRDMNVMDAFSRHQKLVNDYLMLYGGKREDFTRDSSRDRTDHDVIIENHQFLWDDESKSAEFGKKLAKKYWDKLYKEYTICDLTHYKSNKVALRWRVEKEVVSGKGQFICANKTCKDRSGLRSWEVNFAYVEDKEHKNALVKVRLCAECSYKLNYRHKKKEIKKRRLHEPKQPKIVAEKAESSEKTEENSEDKQTEIWSQPVEVEDEKSRIDEFEGYFEDLFL